MGADLRTCDRACMETGRLTEVRIWLIEYWGSRGQMSKCMCSGIITYAQRSNACFCLARLIASTSHSRPRSLERNGRRRKQENVSEWAWPGSLKRRHVLRWPFIETGESQGAGLAISGYDSLTGIDGHAHAAVGMAPEKLRWTPPYAFSHTAGSVTSYMASAAPMASLVVIGCSAVMGRMRPASQRQSIVAASHEA
jgi:hypothetical protein